jgi:hypothetical protein
MGDGMHAVSLSNLLMFECLLSGQPKYKALFQANEASFHVIWLGSSSERISCCTSSKQLSETNAPIQPSTKAQKIKINSRSTFKCGSHQHKTLDKVIPNAKAPFKGATLAGG